MKHEDRMYECSSDLDNSAMVKELEAKLANFRALIGQLTSDLSAAIFREKALLEELLAEQAEITKLNRSLTAYKDIARQLGDNIKQEQAERHETTRKLLVEAYIEGVESAAESALNSGDYERANAYADKIMKEESNE